MTNEDIKAEEDSERAYLKHGYVLCPICREYDEPENFTLSGSLNVIHINCEGECGDAGYSSQDDSD